MKSFLLALFLLSTLCCLSQGLVTVHESWFNPNVEEDLCQKNLIFQADWLPNVCFLCENGSRMFKEDVASGAITLITCHDLNFDCTCSNIFDLETNVCHKFNGNYSMDPFIRDQNTQTDVIIRKQFAKSNTCTKAVETYSETSFLLGMCYVDGLNTSFKVHKYQNDQTYLVVEKYAETGKCDGKKTTSFVKKGLCTQSLDSDNSEIWVDHL
ncbi:hypothetical protein M0813_08332 [Anaeramoeba flamelloides]|uniref:Uncharacterized protein n=1 Tax=Anaeramoeba flamelloides TaxID=1746091 RepID=A0ABQ8X845_9EUKA|nr:hypothetical protein M0813_08332 [Anaeramoeba flamelloides]